MVERTWQDGGHLVTRDLGLSAYLRALDCVLLDVRVSDRPDRAEFVFQQNPHLSSALSRVAAGSLPSTAVTSKVRADLRARAIAVVAASRVSE